MKINKPKVFNYKAHEELRQAYKELLADNNRLMVENRKLREEITNLKIRMRIEEADK